MADEVGFKEPADHWPVFVALGFFCLNEVRQGKDANAIRQLGAAGPEVGKIGYSTHVTHDVDS